MASRAGLEPATILTNSQTFKGMSSEIEPLPGSRAGKDPEDSTRLYYGFGLRMR